MGNLQVAYQSVIDACNDPYIGYNDNDRRTTIKLGVTYNTYCDCASLMSWAMTRGGYFDVNPWFYTGNQVGKMLEAGWTELPITGEWREGDILWVRNDKHHHTEMVYQGGMAQGKTMGAHTAGKAWALQVSINDYITTASGGVFVKLFRDLGGQAGINVYWHQSTDGVTHLSDSEKWDNAVCIYNYMSRDGWTREAIAGLLGNIQQECDLDPFCWQNGIIGYVNTGYGLVQWTPSTNYTNWASQMGYTLTDANLNGNGQCEHICTQTIPTGQWMPTTEYPQTFEQYKLLTDVNLATRVWCANYERAGSVMMENRLQYANYWYQQSFTFPNDIGYFQQGNLGNIITDLQRRYVILGRH